MVPEETIYSNSELKKYNPLLLCEFYERICKVKKKGEESNNDGEGKSLIPDNGGG